MKTPTLLVLVFLFVSPCHAEDIDKKVDAHMGEKLIELLFDHSYEPGIDEVKGLQKNFLVYAVIGERQGMRGDYAVNPWTGDVWNLWGCKRESNSALRKAQAEIKKRFTLEEMKQYHRFHLLRPVNVGLAPC